jgi:hypothetical protein
MEYVIKRQTKTQLVQLLPWFIFTIELFIKSHTLSPFVLVSSSILLVIYKAPILGNEIMELGTSDDNRGWNKIWNLFFGPPLKACLKNFIETFFDIFFLWEHTRWTFLKPFLYIPLWDEHQLKNFLRFVLFVFIAKLL